MRSRGAGGPQAWLLWHGDIWTTRVNDADADTVMLASATSSAERCVRPDVERRDDVETTPAGNCRNQAYDVNT